MTSSPLTVSLPYQSLLLDEPLCTTEMLLKVEQLVLTNKCPEGYLYIERELFCDLLLFYKRAIHSVVRFEADRASIVELADFFKEFELAPTRRMRLCRSDAGLILLAAVVFQNKPVLRATANVADLEQILVDLKARGHAGAILITRGPARNLVYVKDGEPVAAYFADKSAIQPEDSVRDQVLAYVYAAPAETYVEIFHDLQSQRDKHAGQRFYDVMAGKLGPPPFMLTVMQGKKRVQRRLIRGGEAAVGRDPANDLPIDHLSVSRHHCVIEWEKKSFQVRDCESANGTRVNGVRIDKSSLAPGDRINVGDFDVIFSDEHDFAGEEDLQTVFFEPTEEKRDKAQLIIEGQSIPIAGTVFTIGKGKEANLRLRGVFMKRIQATVVRETRGMYRLLRVEGGKRVSVNGHEVSSRGEILDSGAEIMIGKHKLIFVLADE